jgi:hypothetical protein
MSYELADADRFLTSGKLLLQFFLTGKGNFRTFAP